MAIAGQQTSGFKNARRFNTSIMTLMLIYSMLPIAYLIVASTKSPADLYTTFGLAFSEINIWSNLKSLVEYDGGIYFRWLANTVVYSFICASLATMMCASAAYALAKYDFKAKNVISSVILGALMIPQTVLAIPIFLMLAKVGLVDNPLAIILPLSVFVPGVFLMRVYIEQSVPNELIEAARIDGATEVKIFFSIAFRLMAPGLTTVFLLAFVNTWNSFFLPLVVVNSPQYLPITVGLSVWYSIANNGNGGETLFTVILAGALVSVIPIIAVFALMQRYWESGLTTGAVK